MLISLLVWLQLRAVSDGLALLGRWLDLGMVLEVKDVGEGFGDSWDTCLSTFLIQGIFAIRYLLRVETVYLVVETHQSSIIVLVFE